MGSVSRSIRTHAIALLGLTYSLMLVVLVWIAYAERQDEQTAAMQALKDTAQLIASEQDRVLTDTRELLTILLESADRPEFAATPRCSSFLAQILKDEPRLANLGIAAPNGDLVCNATPTAQIVNVADRTHFQRALVSDDMVIAEPILSRSTGKWGLPFDKSIRDRHGRIQGVAIVVVDLHWLNSELSKALPMSRTRIGLVDSRGVVLARQPDPEHWVGRDASATPFFKALALHGGTGTAEAIGLDGTARVFGYAHFVETTSGPIYLWVGTPENEVIASASRRFAWTLAIMLTMLVSTLGAIWVGGERLVLRPLEMIAATARRLGAGDHNARTGLPYRDDEIGQLARSLDEMATALLSKSDLLRLNRALRVLSRCNRALTHAESQTQLLEEVCRILVDLGGYRLAWVGVALQDEAKTVMPVAQCGDTQGYLDAARITWADSERGRGPTGTAIRTGEAQINQDFANNPRLAPWRADALKRGYAASTALPLRERSKVFGALTIYAPDPMAFDDAEMQLMRELADDLAFGIVTLRERSQHAAGAERLMKSLEASIGALATTIEMRDPYTAGHQRRVASLALALAGEVGLPPDEAHGIQLAAMVHDIGKVLIPAEILSKPSRLSELEFELVKTHAQASYDILKGIEFPWPIADMVLQHHERLDGSGYPRGLRGEQILLGARILAVADTVEAMASHRPYRAALGVEKALAEIRANRGRLYEPAVVDACERLFATKRFAF